MSAGEEFDANLERQQKPVSEKGKPPVLTVILVALNVAVFVVCDLFLYRYADMLTYYLSMNPLLLLYEKQYWRIITSMFYHFSMEHLMGNMLMLFYIGSVLEQAVGKVRYGILYFISGLVAEFVSILYNSSVMGNSGMVFSAGASGAVFGLIGAFTALTLCGKRMTQMRKSDIPVFLFFVLFAGFLEKDVDNAAHVGGFLAGVLLGMLFWAWKKGKLQNGT